MEPNVSSARRAAHRVGGRVRGAGEGGAAARARGGAVRGVAASDAERGGPGHRAAGAVGAVRGEVPRVGDDQGAGRAGREGRRRQHDRDDDRDADGRQDGLRDRVRAGARRRRSGRQQRLPGGGRRADAVAAAFRRPSSRTRASTRASWSASTRSPCASGTFRAKHYRDRTTYGEQVDFWIDDSVGPIGLIRLEAEQKQHPTIRAGFKFELVATGNDAVAADRQAGPALRRRLAEEAWAAVDAAIARRPAASGQGDPMTYVGRHGRILAPPTSIVAVGGRRLARDIRCSVPASRLL